MDCLLVGAGKIFPINIVEVPSDRVTKESNLTSSMMDRETLCAYRCEILRRPKFAYVVFWLGVHDLN